MADLRISELRQILEGEVQGIDEYPLADRSSNETRKIRASDLAKSTIRLLPDGGIPIDKVNTTDLLPTYDRGISKDDTNEVGHNNTEITPGTRLGITYDEYGHVVIAEPDKVFGWGIVEGLDTIGHSNLVVEGSHAGITWDVHGHITAAEKTIPSADLPIATDITLGAVYVPTDSGLTVTGAGAVRHSWSLTANTTGATKITYDNYGHVTGSVDLEGTDLPIATATTPGAVIVPNTSPLEVDGAGSIEHKQIGAEGQYTKVSVDAYGHVSSGESLAVDDLPTIPVEKLEGSITKDTTLSLGDCAVTAPSICDYATSYMQEGSPGVAEFLGQLWYQPSTAQLRIYARGSAGDQWLPVGFGALQANNLRWGGAFDAETGLLTVLTAIGTAEGLKAGEAFPAPSDPLSGLYFICQTEGNNITQPDLSGTTFTPGDWALCVDENQGWVHIDAGATGGGGGGGASYLNDLLDVQLAGTTANELLKFDGGSGLWKNSLVIDGGSID